MQSLVLEQNAQKVVWEPLAGSQALSQSCPANVILMHGTRGPGKTDSQLMRFRRRVGQGYGRFWRGIIFDREYKNLDDLVSKSLRWYPEFGDGARFLSSKSDYRWVWPTGEELLFRAIKKESDYWGYHGQEFPFIGWNELTKYPTDVLFDMMMSCNRSSFRPEDYPCTIDGDLYKATGEVRFIEEDERTAVEWLLPDIPLEVFITCNPYGAGHNWVKKRFINAAPPGRIFKRVINVFNPRTQKREDVVKTQVHLFGTYRENKYLSPEYIAELESITDQNKRRAWLGGDWDIVAGGMFDDTWDRWQHVLKPFRIPVTWRITRSFDWGSSKPFSVGWWAESDGSDVQLQDGTWRSTVKGDQFRIAEWYGYSGKANVGLRMLASEVAAGIIERELVMGIHGRVQPGAADNSIWDSENGNSIAADMLKRVKVNGNTYSGVEWRRSDKSPGSRKDGWEKMRRYFRQALRTYMVTAKGVRIPLPREKPGIFIFDNCKHFIDLVPTLPRDEVDQDDVDTESEDHIGDETRYHVLSLGLGARGGRTKGTG
jgi:hypothetical protein